MDPEHARRRDVAAPEQVADPAGGASCPASADGLPAAPTEATAATLFAGGTAATPCVGAASDAASPRLVAGRGVLAASRPLRSHRFAIAIVGLLLGATVVCAGLLAARMAYSHTVHYWFLLWNLALAWVPFFFAGVAYTLASSRRALLYVFIALAALAWLVFFPNAPYILTDFLHLGSMGDIVPGWFDVLMLYWFAWTGLMLGIVSLYLMQELVARAFGRPTSWIFAVAVALLGSVGIYLGRFLRWNSWDLLRRPMPLAGQLFGDVTHRAAQPRLLGFTLMFAALFLFIYVAVFIFAKLAKPQERAGR